MRQFMVNAASRGVREANRALGVRIVKNVVWTAVAAVGFAWASMPAAVAKERPVSRPTNSTNVSVASSSKADDGKMERKCVIMSCGTPWCYSVRR